MCLASKHLEKLDQIEKEISDDFDFLSRTISQYDKELSEIYHSIEVARFSASQGYKMMKELQDLLKKRRIAKNEYSRMTSLVKTINFQSLRDRIKNADKNLGKIMRKNDNYTDGWNMELFMDFDKSREALQ